jgi:6-phosphogluconate dehydrogenase
VDDFIAQLLEHLEPGDIIIDGGNSYFEDTRRRFRELQRQGIGFIGTGISGGEEGALLGPSIMPGGEPEAWPAVRPIFQAIAARTDDGDICCDWVGHDGAGHFVKMVHNGIEYGDMQMIAEVYQLLRDGLGMPLDDMASLFADWNEGELQSYLVEITRDILAYRDAEGQSPLDYILDAAGQKGTGKWTVQSALDLGLPLTLIAEAVFARGLSALKDERQQAVAILGSPRKRIAADAPRFIADLRQTLYAAKIISYAQGFQLLRAAAASYRWDLRFGSIAMMWRGGCIIRSRFLGRIKEAYDRDAALANLLFDPFFRDAVLGAEAAWRRVMSAGIEAGIPMPALSAALAYLDGYRCDRLPATLLQAQRDYFGAHTYERIDRPRGEFFHTNWTGRGGDTASTSYTA